MKPIIFTIFLFSTLFLNVKAQDSVEISQLKPVQKLTKAKLKKLKKLSGDSYDPFDIQTIDLSVQIETKILSNGKKVSVIKAEFKSNSLFFKGIDKEESVASVNTFGKITSNDKNIEGIFEDAVNFVLTKEQIGKLETLFYQKTFELPEGKYKLQFFVKDTQTGIGGLRSVNFEIK
ncbi:MAG: hypothetical protein K1X72_27520 [Pyrinomonadaceae bacterium]|nr:hypothetical protein [Pyrinomonadaceae bacterium]